MQIDFVVKAKHGIIYDYVQKHGLTIKQLAEQIGIRYSTLCDLINFKYAPKYPDKAPAVIKVCELLKCLPDDICPPELTREIRKSLGKRMVIKRQVELTALPEPQMYALEAGDEYNPEQIAMRAEEDMDESLRNTLRTLTPKEEKVLRLRFGIDEKSDHTLAEVGKDFKITREGIRQIEAKALKKLRHPIRSNNLKSFI